MGGHQQFQLTDDIPVPTEEQVCLDPILDRSQTHLLQLCGLSNDESRVTQVCERGSAPEIEGVSKGFRGPRRVPSGQLLGTLRRGAAKLLDINGHAGAKAVPRSDGLDGISTKASPQRRMCTCTVLTTEAGGLPPHKPASRSGRLTHLGARRASSATIAARRGPPARG